MCSVHRSKILNTICNIQCTLLKIQYAGIISDKIKSAKESLISIENLRNEHRAYSIMLM